MNLIDREDLLYHLDKNLSHLRAEGWSCKKLWKMVLQTIRLAPTETVNGWIPVSEPPKEEGRYLVARYDQVSKSYFYDILWYEKEEWWNRQYYGTFAVIAWKPIEPYTGDKE